MHQQGNFVGIDCPAMLRNHVVAPSCAKVQARERLVYVGNPATRNALLQNNKCQPPRGMTENKKRSRGIIIETRHATAWKALCCVACRCPISYMFRRRLSRAAFVDLFTKLPGTWRQPAVCDIHIQQTHPGQAAACRTPSKALDSIIRTYNNMGPNSRRPVPCDLFLTFVYTFPCPLQGSLS